MFNYGGTRNANGNGLGGRTESIKSTIYYQQERQPIEGEQGVVGAAAEREISSNYDSCAFSIDYESCNCIIHACDHDDQIESEIGDRFAPLVDCSDVVLADTTTDDTFDPIIDFCTVGKSLTVGSGVFEFLSLGEFDICVDTSPSNDNCIDATPVSVAQNSSLAIVGDLSFALSSSSTPESCASYSIDTGLWFSVIGQGYVISHWRVQRLNQSFNVLFIPSPCLTFRLLS